MKNPHIVKALQDLIQDEQRKIKVSIIEDIFKAGKCLNGFCSGYSEYLQPTAFMFYHLYDLDIERLELICAELSRELSVQARRAAMLL